MAAAEARAGWQRIANRCFVQEDARGAPKLPRCPSKSESDDSIPVYAANYSDRPVSGFVPHNQNVLPDAKWWLHLQPNSGHLKNFSKEKLEAEIGVSSTESVDQTVEFVRENQLIEEYCTQSYHHSNTVSLVDHPWRAFPASRKDDQDGKVLQDLEGINGDNLLKKPKHKDIRELWDADDNLTDLEPCNCLTSEQPKKLCSELDSNWVGEENYCEPWWRTADKDELASLVSHKSIEYFENCDLPRPHGKHFGNASVCPQCSNKDKLVASLDRKAEKEMSTLADYMQETPTSISIGSTLGAVGCSPHGSSGPFSTPKADDEEIQILHKTNGDLSKGQLIEALCHSQTRAREAEEAAQKAYDEKDHIIKLFFRQASHLFAYKQWLHILQLETICLQLKNNYPLSTCFPDLLLRKGKKLRKVRRMAAKKRPDPPRCEVCSCAFAFAVGLGLAGAGLLLGWTMGWLFPSL